MLTMLSGCVANGSNQGNKLFTNTEFIQFVNNGRKSSGWAALTENKEYDEVAEKYLDLYFEGATKTIVGENRVRYLNETQEFREPLKNQMAQMNKGEREYRACMAFCSPDEVGVYFLKYWGCVNSNEPVAKFEHIGLASRNVDGNMYYFYVMG